MKRFVIEMEFSGGMRTFLPNNGEDGELGIFYSFASAQEAATLKSLRQTLLNFNDDACDYPVAVLVGAKIFELVEVS